MRKIIIGDVHGCYNELIELLKKVKYNESEDKIIFVGDYTDRGTQNVEVYHFIKDLKERVQDNCILIRGNHEEMMREYFEENGHDWTRYNNGGHKTLADFEDKDAVIAEYLKFIKENTNFYYVDDNFQVVHAGLYDEDPQNNSNEDLVWDRDPIKYGLYNGKLTIVGHTPFKSPALIQKSNKAFEPSVTPYSYKRWYTVPATGLLNIDTGCVFGYNLTAMIVEDNKMIFKSVQKIESE